MATLTAAQKPKVWRPMYLRVSGGDHGHIDPEHGLVPIDPLQIGQGDVRGEMAVGWGWAVRCQAQVELPQLDLTLSHQGDPLEGGGREGGRAREGGREGRKTVSQKYT